MGGFSVYWTSSDGKGHYLPLVERDDLADGLILDTSRIEVESALDDIDASRFAYEVVSLLLVWYIRSWKKLRWARSSIRQYPRRVQSCSCSYSTKSATSFWYRRCGE